MLADMLSISEFFRFEIVDFCSFLVPVVVKSVLEAGFVRTI
jgi:hypothetical protein